MKPCLRQAAFFVALVLAAGCSRKADPPAAASPPPETESVTEHATALMQRALQRRTEHRWNEALGDYEIAKKLAADDPEVHRGVKLFERLGKFLAEIRELDARIALAPDDDQMIADRALLFLRADDPELALSDSKLAAEKAPWAVRPKLFAALALVALGRGDECEALGVERRIHLNALAPEFLEAVSRLDAEISVERNNPDLFVSRAWQLNEVGQPQLALADAETAVLFDQNSASAHAERSYALTKLGRADEAYDEIKRATELDANLAPAWQYRGELELARNDFAAAVESLSHALTLAPTVAALQKRELAYRQIGDAQKADEDLHALEALSAH